MQGKADHGGGIDAACAVYGGGRADWIDLSTGINPRPYPLPPLPSDVWTALPDQAAMEALIQAARQFWHVPDGAAILAAHGASALIARIPALGTAGRVRIASPTYNEHARSFAGHGWDVLADGVADAAVVVHPNNPDGRLFALPNTPLTVIDESFCDVMPDASHIAHATRAGVIVLKSFGKFWGLAGLRLGFAIGDPALIAQLTAMLGPWSVSGAALEVGRVALSDPAWAEATRARLAVDSARLDGLLAPHAALVGGTTLFRLYHTDDARALQDRLARAHIWSRVFPYSPHWLRLGLPDGEKNWARLERALNA